MPSRSVQCEYKPSGEPNIYVCQTCGHRFRSKKPPEALHRICFVRPSGGPGTELKRLLKRLGIKPDGTCNCEHHAAQMDAWGPDGCEENMDAVVGWLEKEARKRCLPFVRFGAEQLVRLAIRRARRKEARRNKEEP